MTLGFILVLIFISAVALLNNKYLNKGTSYVLAGAISFAFVIGLIYAVATILII
jgi:hypothetical protein